MAHNLHKTLKEFDSGSGKGKFYSLPKLGKELKTKIERLPVSIRIVLESVLRNYDGKKITEEHIEQLANWKPNAKRVDEIPFVVSRVVLQDFTGVPLLADIAAMRGVAKRAGKNPKKIEPLVPVDLVVDHSVQIDYFRQKDALDLNMKLEFQRNNERYQFMKWGMQAFDTFKVVPPGVGIVHQVNLEYLARGVHKKKDDGDTVYYPDTLVGTDSHTTMINGIGVVGWGVGGIEAEAGMLGQPGVLPHAGRRRRRAQGQAARRRDGHRPRADDHRNAAQGKGRRQVRRILRRRHEDARAAGPRDDREHGAGIRRDDGLLPGRREDHRLLQGHGPHEGGNRRVRELLQGAGTVRHPEGGRNRLHEDADAGSLDGRAVARGPEASAGPHRDRQREVDVHRSVLEARRGKRLREEGRRSDGRVPDEQRRGREERRRADRRDHVMHEHVEPERAARRRPAREEGRRSRPHRRAAHQDLARPGIAHRHRIPDEDGPAALPRQARLRSRRLRLHDLHRQRGRSHARAERSDHEERHRRGGRAVGATATSRRAFIRTSARTSSRRRRSSSRTRSPATSRRI
ncbi:aconitate hydratase 1 [Burkholderia pseudomallei Pakistan 9]|nr:aconitate hydratase 1 [Burkholderia pseudomallei Pakistan 9]